MKAKNFILIALASILFFWQCSQEQSSKNKEETSSNKENTTQVSEADLRAKADSAIKITFKTLSGKLKHTIQNDGIEAAINVCKEDAMRITDSLSQALNLKIKRTSHKVRNPQNAPDEWENKILTMYLEKTEKGEPLEPVLEQVNGKWRYAKPIKIKPQCLMCHGEPAGKVKELLQEKYPEDQAVGFKEGDLRGIWSVEL